MEKLISISQLSYKLNLISSNNKKPKNYILRYWEKEFRQIKPKIINKRRYYSTQQIELIKLIHFLLKNKGMTINGVKKVLNTDINKLDDYNSHSLQANYYRDNLKDKSKKLLNKIRNLKKHGKKITY
tara:strand:+ start:339 stop:719 length:381 start_codon:yes stop_codon:yes gene_type:complete